MGNDYTQPRTDAERKRADEFRLRGMTPFLGMWIPPSPERNDGGDGPNPGPEIDWLEINREFGI